MSEIELGNAGKDALEEALNIIYATQWKIARKRIVFDGTDGAGLKGTSAIMFSVTGAVQLFHQELVVRVVEELEFSELLPDSEGFTAYLGTQEAVDTESGTMQSLSVLGVEAAVVPIGFWLSSSFGQHTFQLDVDEPYVIDSDIVLKVSPSSFVDVVSGALEVYFLWLPLSEDGNLEAAA